MSAPQKGEMDLLKRLSRYLAGTPRAVYTYPWQTEPSQIDGFVDSDWAGCSGSRRSTSGGAMLWARHVLKSYSTTQATIALSSAEAELYALVKGAAQMLGMIALATRSQRYRLHIERCVGSPGHRATPRHRQVAILRLSSCGCKKRCGTMSWTL